MVTFTARVSTQGTGLLETNLDDVKLRFFEGSWQAASTSSRGTAAVDKGPPVSRLLSSVGSLRLLPLLMSFLDMSMMGAAFQNAPWLIQNSRKTARGSLRF